MKYIQMPLKSFLKRYPFIRTLLPMSDAEIDSEPYVVRYTPDFQRVELGFESDEWQIA